MGHIERKILEDFLRKSGFDNAVGAMDALELFYQIAERGQFDLASKKEINKKDIEGIISVATGETVDEVCIIPMNKFFIKMEEIISLDFYLKREFSSIWMENSKNDTLTTLSGVFSGSLGIGVSESLFASLDDIFSFKYSVGVWNALNKNLFYFLWFFLKKDKRIARLEAILPLWQKCFIVGRKKDSSGTWLVVI